MISLTDVTDGIRYSVVAYSLPMFAVAAAGIMGWLISYLGVAREIAEFISSVSQKDWGVLIMLMIFSLIVGTVLSPMTAVIIFLPIIKELGLVAQIPDIHLALVVCLSLAELWGDVAAVKSLTCMAAIARRYSWPRASRALAAAWAAASRPF